MGLSAHLFSLVSLLTLCFLCGIIGITGNAFLVLLFCVVGSVLVLADCIFLVLLLVACVEGYICILRSRASGNLRRTNSVRYWVMFGFCVLFLLWLYLRYGN